MPKQREESEARGTNETTPNACQACNELDNSRMVQCDMCDDWYHFDCVGVNQDVENHDWLCSVCMEKQQTKNKKSTKSIPLPVPSKPLPNPVHTNNPPKAQQVLEDNLSQHSAAIFGQSVKQRQLQMELQILDDERKIQEEEEANRRQYLRKRHELMTKMVRETAPVADVEEERSNQRVSEWISETVNANVQDTHCPRADVVPEQFSQRIQRSSTPPAAASSHPHETPQNMQPISNQRIENAEGGFIPRRRSTPRQTSI
ncbi:uncharacterized protein LOC128736122 [Sabethes cyaneus]|uniref:uncharacterized protein LOC128736122 n=1 Tax=Sabethes cyaneus TaxID=53552 RepID=UPI00237DA3E0|nr:uncharacterized protein LOC128736122 [Sabethes cyaneus]